MEAVKKERETEGEGEREKERGGKEERKEDKSKLNTERSDSISNEIEERST